MPIPNGRGRPPAAPCGFGPWAAGGLRVSRSGNEASGIRREVQEKYPRFSALVPIPNRRGRHPAAPFGLGPWDGARVASQQSLVLRPGQRYCSHQKKAVLSQRRHEEARIGPVVRSELPWGNLRSLPWGPTRVGTWMRRFPPARGEGKPHDALDGVALTGRNSHQIIPRLPDRRPGRAAHGSS